MAVGVDPYLLRTMADDELWKQCRREAFRGSGPGGQKRNKTSSAVRVVHEPTGMAAVASESRSQAENRGRAFRRLRKALAMEVRQPLDASTFVPPTWFAERFGGNRPITLSDKNEIFLPVAGMVLDVLEATSGSVADAARLLDIGTARFVSILESDEVLWSYANRIRAACGLKTLKRV
jgi:hypothetical protein